MLSTFVGILLCMALVGVIWTYCQKNEGFKKFVIYGGIAILVVMCLILWVIVLACLFG